MSDAPELKPLDVAFVDVTKHNVGQIRVLNSALIPVSYSDAFYVSLAEMWPLDNPLIHMAYHSDVLVGALTSRREALPAVAGDYTTPAKILRATDDVIPKGGGPKTRSVSKVPDTRVYIATVGVLAPYRRRGIADKMLTRLIENCSKEGTGVKEIYIHVHTENHAALALYKKHGFNNVQTIENYYQEGIVSPRSAFVLVKDLRSSA